MSLPGYEIKVILTESKGTRQSTVLESFLWGETSSYKTAQDMLGELRKSSPLIKKDSTSYFDDAG